MIVTRKSHKAHVEERLIQIEIDELVLDPITMALEVERN
jgi:hypothetical protein